MTCRICPHKCDLSANPDGFCGGRNNYAKVTAVALDPIEKKPLRHFHAGSTILSVGSFGCNMRCGFCQNHHISMCEQVGNVYISPDELAEKAASLTSQGNIGVAFTYNEPLIGFEYVLDCAKAVRGKGLKNVIVTNGLINAEPLSELLPYIDAANIDLKGFTDEFYKKHCGDLETVKNAIVAASEVCHAEVTTLIIPNENDSTDEIESAAKWLAGVDRNIPWHISRYFPNHEYSVTATDVGHIRTLAEVARGYLTHVYTGNC
ncbi:MAG: AmmeMemoRadiSam system radical SAM enzyme [Oscillospiraceae bacterium]|nr:AmmeMemoRadiSam system radical SAM enzyme [Oscillospiraceae bacterium]